MTFDDIFRAQGVNIPRQQVTFDNMYLGPNGQPLATQPAQAGPASPAPGSGVPPMNPNQTNINPNTGRPYSYMDSMNDSNGQLMYDPGQSSLANLINGRFRTQGDPAFGQIQPMQQGQSPFAAQLANTNQISQSALQAPQGGMADYIQGQYTQPGMSQNGGMYGNMFSQFPQGMGNNGFGGSGGTIGFTRPYFDARPSTGGAGPIYGQGMGNNGFGGMSGGGMSGGFRGFDFSNPMNYSGYSNWNQPRRQSGKGMG